MEYDLEKLSNKIGRKNAIKKVLKKIFTIFLLILALINVILLGYSIKGEKSPNVFGLYFFNIVSRKYGTNFND